MGAREFRAHGLTTGVLPIQFQILFGFLEKGSKLYNFIKPIVIIQTCLKPKQYKQTDYFPSSKYSYLYCIIRTNKQCQLLLELRCVFL